MGRINRADPDRRWNRFPLPRPNGHWLYGPTIWERTSENTAEKLDATAVTQQRPSAGTFAGAADLRAGDSVHHF